MSEHQFTYDVESMVLRSSGTSEKKKKGRQIFEDLMGKGER